MMLIKLRHSKVQRRGKWICQRNKNCLHRMISLSFIEQVARHRSYKELLSTEGGVGSAKKKVCSGNISAEDHTVPTWFVCEQTPIV